MKPSFPRREAGGVAAGDGFGATVCQLATISLQTLVPPRRVWSDELQSSLSLADAVNVCRVKQANRRISARTWRVQSNQAASRFRAARRCLTEKTRVECAHIKDVHSAIVNHGELVLSLESVKWHSLPSGHPLEPCWVNRSAPALTRKITVF